VVASACACEVVAPSPDQLKRGQRYGPSCGSWGVFVLAAGKEEQLIWTPLRIGTCFLR
jgi:hypothetical protein